MDADANVTKDLTVWEIIHVSGLFCSSYSVVAAVVLLAVALAAAMTAAYGLLSYYSSAADLAAITVAAAATTAVSNPTFSFCSNGRSFTYTY